MQFDESLLNETLVYSSSKMFERRRRIMEETRALVAEHGHDGFNIRELCQRAKVAPQTVYKAFESKERLVAISIRQHFHSYSVNQTYNQDAATLKGVIEHIMVSDESMRSVRQYSKAIVAIYFSQTADTDLRDAASYNVMNTIKPWVAALRQAGNLRRGITAEAFTDAVAHLLFGVSLEWCLDNITVEDFLFMKLEVLLVYAAGATRGAGQKEVTHYLSDLFGSRQLITAIGKTITRQGAPAKRRKA
jgi:AcrR family transcriptional regulator